MQTFSENDTTADIEKGFGISNQLRIWDKLLEIRIQLQKLLVESNNLPRFDLFENVIKTSASKDSDELKITASVQHSRTCIKQLMEKLLELQSLTTSPVADSSLQEEEESITSEDEDEIPDEVSKHSDSGLKSSEDEAITSDEDETNDKVLPFAKGSQDSISINQESGDEDLSSDEHSDNKDDDDGPVKPKKKRLNDYDQIISKNFKASISRRNEVIQKWNDKTQVASGKLSKNNFSAFQVSTVKQIDHILSNKDRLLKRTQKHHDQEKIDEENFVNEEIFNDDDFFHQLLRELIESSGSNNGVPLGLNRNYLELQKLRTKLKRKIDTKASKGRRIRYDVHPKLVNFMSPYEEKNSMSEMAKTELYKSVFKNASQWKGSY